MKCIDCIEVEAENIKDAVVYLVDYETVKPLCQEHYDEYAYMQGDVHLDSYSIEITGVGSIEFIKRINEVLKYINEKKEKFADRYHDAKKLGEKWSKTPADPYHDASSDLPLSVRLPRKFGRELLDTLDWYKSVNNGGVRSK